VIPQPVNGPQPLGQRLPHQCVREAEPPWLLRQLVEQPRLHSLVQQRQDPFRLGTAGPGQELESEAGTHQGCQLKRPARGDAEAVKTPLQHLADTPGQAERLAGEMRQASLRPEQPYQLGGEERVSPGGIVDPGGESRIRQLPGDGGQVSGEFRPVQPLQADPSGLGSAGQLGERRGGGRIRRQLLVAERHHKEQWVLPGLTHQMAKQQQRRRVGPVRIIQHDHQATPARCDPQER